MPSSIRVYPRVGGGTGPSPSAPMRASGLSPRGRGNPAAIYHPQTQEGSIPAWAGEPRSLTSRTRRPWVYPRVGGGTLDSFQANPEGCGLSPRGRGNRWTTSPSSIYRGSIPAWAGEPASTTAANSICGVYPRVGGGTFGMPQVSRPFWGLSPRGRGNRWLREVGPHRRRSIPAWAGEPISALPAS